MNHHNFIPTAFRQIKMLPFLPADPDSNISWAYDYVIWLFLRPWLLVQAAQGHIKARFAAKITAFKGTW